MGLNRRVNRVEVNGEAIIDLTGDTVSADNLPKGITAHNAAGYEIVGTAEFISSSTINSIVLSSTAPTVDDKTVLTIVLSE